MTDMRRYFIGYVPDGTERAPLDALRKEIASRFDVSAALRMPPHVTLYPPFDATVGDRARLADALADIARPHAPFTVDVTGFGAFGDSTWFVEPADDDRLLALHADVDRAVTAAMGTDSRPERRKPHFHLTLAYKDVSPDTHRRIGEFLRQTPVPVSTLRVDNITLFIREPEADRWTTATVFALHGA